MTPRAFTPSEALTLVRFFCRLDQQSVRAMSEGRDQDGRSLAGLHGALSYRVFGVSVTREFGSEENR